MKTLTCIINSILVVACIGILSKEALASTYYVRADGGSATQCTGLSDAPYPGSGTGQSCAFSHPFWAIAPQGNNPTKMVGGDTLIIDGSNNAQYVMGYGAPNLTDSSQCGAGYPWGCLMRDIPSGPDPVHPTRILGKGWDTGCTNPPQLWGNEHLPRVIGLNGSNNVELQCMEITDHSACQDGGPAPCNRNSAPYGAWADVGIEASDSSNVLLRNVNIHGMAHGGVHAGRLKDWTLEDTKIIANAFVGWDGDIGTGVSSNSGTMTFNRVKIQYSGCGETYPGNQPYNCFSQSQGGYGDGLGTQQTGGNWIFTDSDVSHNVSDGIDLLYHDGTGLVTINRTRAEGNAGNQIKSATSTNISNSVIIGNCSYFNNNPVAWQSSGFDNCRAAGNAVALAFVPGTMDTISNSTLVSNGNDLIVSIGSSCNGTETIKSTNNIFLARPYYYGGGDNSSLYYASGATGNGDGPCGSVKLIDDYSVIYSTKNGVNDCTGKAHSKCVDPKLTEALVSYYSGNAYNVNLVSSSPAIGAGLVMAGASTLDFSSKDRGTSSWDIGAMQFATSAGGAPSTPTTPSVTASAPIVAITSPTSQTSFTAGSNVTVTATASENNGTIANVSFYNGSTLLGSTNVSPYSFTWNNVPAGAYSLTAKATDASNISTTSVPVTGSVSALAGLPVVSITSPANQSSFAAGANITLTASASEVNGAITKVDFYNGSTLLGSSSVSPYTYTWSAVAAGSYNLTAVATDLNGASTTSSSVAITVAAATTTVQAGIPDVAITSPSSNSVFAAGNNISINATAVSLNSTIKKVYFYDGSALLGSSAVAPYNFIWKNVPAGTHTINAETVDNNGVWGHTSSVTVTVTAPPTTNPTTITSPNKPYVVITYPTDQMRLSVGSTLTIKALASETNGSIAKVDFYIFNGLLGTSTAGPYQQNWKLTKAGTYSFNVKATDSNGVSTTSKMVTVYIK